MIGRDGELTGVVEKVVQQQLRGEQRQERQQDGGGAGAQDVPEVARRSHEHVLDRVGEDPTPLGDAVGHHVQALLQQDHIGGGTGDVRRGVDREAHVGLVQRQRVVDAVTEKADRSAARGQRTDHPRLLLG